MNRERGTVTLWVLGLCIALMFLGGLSLDLWRAVSARRELSAMADAAATAGANGIDEPSLRAGTVRVDPDRARALASQTLGEYPHAAAIDAGRVDVDGNRVTVTLRDHVRFSLLGLFMGGQQFEVEVHATGRAERAPLGRTLLFRAGAFVVVEVAVAAAEFAVIDAGLAAVDPVLVVVGGAFFGWGAAAGAAFVAGDEGAPDGVGDDALAAADVEGFAGAVDDDAVHVGAAGEAAHGFFADGAGVVELVADQHAEVVAALRAEEREVGDAADGGGPLPDFGVGGVEVVLADPDEGVGAMLGAGAAGLPSRSGWASIQVLKAVAAYSWPSGSSSPLRMPVPPTQRTRRLRSSCLRRASAEPSSPSAASQTYFTTRARSPAECNRAMSTSSASTSRKASAAFGVPGGR